MRPLASTRPIVLVAVAIPIVAAAVARFWSPDLLAALTLIPPWCWLFLGITTILVARWAGRKRLAAGLGVIWFLFALGAVEETRSLLNLEIFAQAPSRDRLRIVSLNCANMPKCLVDLMATDPDVVLLQEAPGDTDVARMARELFGESGSALCGGDTAILARGAIEPKHLDRAGHFVAGTVTLSPGMTLDCVSLRLGPPPPDVEFWSSTFWIRHRDCRLRHRQELEEVVSTIERMSATTPKMPFVVGGDFNTTPGDPVLAELRPRFHDAFFSSGAGIGGTGTNELPLFRVDQVWNNARVRPIRTWAVKTAWSDHRMVVCDLELRP